MRPDELDFFWQGPGVTRAASLLDEAIREERFDSEPLVEAIIGDNDLVPIHEMLHTANIIGDSDLGDLAAFDGSGAQQVGRAVALLWTAAGPATGFLVAGDRIVTNYHVFPDKDRARGAVARFNYQLVGGELQPWSDHVVDPDLFFETDSEVDAAVVGVRGDPGATWGVVRVRPPGSPHEGRPAFIIQHPLGGPKSIGVKDNEIQSVTETKITYLTDTLRGSSGSPIFDERFEVIGLHSTGGVIANEGPLGILYYNNLGFRIEAVTAALNL